MTTRRKTQIYDLDCFLIIRNILQLKVLYSPKTSHKCKLVTNLMTSSMFGGRCKIGIWSHSPYDTTCVWAFTTKVQLFWWHPKSHHLLEFNIDMWQHLVN